MLFSALIIGFTDNAWAGSIQTSGHIHHNPAQLSKRKICCCWGNNQTSAGEHLSLWTAWIHRKQQSIKDKSGEKTFKTDKKCCVYCHAQQSTELSLPFTEYDYCTRFMGARAGWAWFIFVYSNKQCQCSGLWQTLNWIVKMADVMNKLLLRHFLFSNEKTNIKCCGDFIFTDKGTVELSITPMTAALSVHSFHVGRIHQLKHWFYWATDLYSNYFYSRCGSHSVRLQQMHLYDVYISPEWKRKETVLNRHLLGILHHLHISYLFSMYGQHVSWPVGTRRHKHVFTLNTGLELGQSESGVLLWDVIQPTFYSSAYKHDWFIVLEKTL